MSQQSANFASGIYNSVSTVVSSVSNYSGDSFQVLGQDKDILKIGNVLNSIFINRNDIEIPKNLL